MDRDSVLMYLSPLFERTREKTRERTLRFLMAVHVCISNLKPNESTQSTITNNVIVEYWQLESPLKQCTKVMHRNVMRRTIYYYRHYGSHRFSSTQLQRERLNAERMSSFARRLVSVTVEKVWLTKIKPSCNVHTSFVFTWSGLSHHPSHMS